MSATKSVTNYDSDHDVFDLSFYTVEMMTVPTCIKDGSELNMEGLEKMFGQDDSPILKSCIILNSQSTVNCVRNRKCLTNIWSVDTTVVTRCNDGVQRTKYMGDFKGFPEPVWLDEDGIVNIILSIRAKKYFKILYDNNNNNGFVVIHQESGLVRHFHESQKGLYYMDMNQCTIHALVTTVKENKEKYTSRDVGKDTLTREQQNIMRCSARDLVITVCSHVKNFSVTGTYKNLAEKIYGPSIAGVRGKTV